MKEVFLKELGLGDHCIIKEREWEVISVSAPGSKANTILRLIGGQTMAVLDPETMRVQIKESAPSEPSVEDKPDATNE